tara:strand:- start:420 stop:527 length:108 start_codon:yes stop_codon:yes gene_type:complete
MNLLKRIWKWFREDEGMTWERYHRNMEAERKNKRK